MIRHGSKSTLQRQMRGVATCRSPTISYPQWVDTNKRSEIEKRLACALAATVHASHQDGTVPRSRRKRRHLNNNL